MIGPQAQDKKSPARILTGQFSAYRTRKRIRGGKKTSWRKRRTNNGLRKQWPPSARPTLTLDIGNEEGLSRGHNPVRDFNLPTT
ncbi:hypothetical protein MNBD_ALPHA01-517 [hydrothermal vent metagenome]|uniref:Uncharacterized protein n=1 Tax=hydrothermal vent metagenome TaxID=652676 RepID=A0A3B0SRD3_9ZZZZ